MAVDCTALEDFEKDCLNNVGGLYQIIFGDQDDLTVTKDEATNALTAASVSTVAKSITLRKGQGNFTDPATIDLVAGSSLVTTTVQMNPTRRDAANTRALKILGQGQRYLYGFLKDGNGIWWYAQDLQLSGFTGSSGGAKAEGSKYEITLTNEVALEQFGFVVPEALVLALLTV